jgi:site-specific DNA recombinase
MKNVVAYIRVSTEGQCGDDKFGLEAQREQIIDYCAKNDMNILEWFTDEGESGAYEREGFDEIVYGDVANPPYEAVIVAKSDRVARDINVYFYYKMLLTKKDIKLISIAEDFGQFGAFAPFLEAFTLCVAQMERENITKRTKSGRKVKASKGGYSGGRAPMGYKVHDKKLVIDPEEAEIVRFIFERKFAGKTMLSTVDALNEAGYQTRNGKAFVISTVQSIWNNERTYRGEYKYGENGEWVKGEHEPILR